MNHILIAIAKTISTKTGILPAESKSWSLDPKIT